MKLILKEDVNKRGEAGEIVEVAPGYGRNFLIPQGKAVMATGGALKQLELAKSKAAQRAQDTVADARALADRLEATTVTIAAAVGENDKIHGSVTTQDIAEALAERDINVDRKK